MVIFNGYVSLPGDILCHLGLNHVKNDESGSNAWEITLVVTERYVETRGKHVTLGSALRATWFSKSLGKLI